MLQEQRDLYKSLFQVQNSSHQVSFSLKQTNKADLPLQCSAKSNELLLLGFQNQATIIDLITRNSLSIKSLEGETISAVGIGYYNNFIFIGSSRGTLRIIRLKRTTKQFNLGDQFTIKLFSSSVIQNVYSTNGDLVIVICMDEIQFYFINDALRESTTSNNQQPLIHDINANQINIIADQFPVIITACEFSHQSNQLVIALGDHNIYIYTVVGDSINRVIEQVKKIPVEEFGVIRNLSIHNDGKLLAYTQINIFNKNEFKIFVSDLKKYDKNILTHTQKDEGKSVQIAFFPVSTRLLVAHDQKYFTLDIDSSEPDNKQNQNIQSFKASSLVLNIYPLSQIQDFPNFLYIDEKGQLSILVFDFAKINQLLQIPFLYFVEQRLQETLGYKPIMQKEFQTKLKQGFTGDGSQNDVQNIMFNGETYFEPFFERIGKWGLLRDYYQTYRRKFLSITLQSENWPLKQIADWGLRREQLQSVNSQILDSYQRPQESRILLEQNDNRQIKNSVISQNQDTENIQERYLLLTKLFDNIALQGKEIFLLGNCQYLFTDKLQFSSKVLKMLNTSEKIEYLDLSNNKISIEFVSQIQKLQQLRFLDLSGNQLGINLKKGTIEKSRTYMNIFNNIPIINLRNNNYSNDHGIELMKILENNTKINVLDISGNPHFGDGTYQQLQVIMQKKITNLKNTQTLIIEFDPLISQRSMIKLTNSVIRNLKQLKKNATQMNFFLYIVNSNQKIQWNQSLLEMYEEIEFGEEDEIKSCVQAFLLTISECLVQLFANIKKNCQQCALQCFCSTLIIKKYIFCGYCIFLQTSIGKFIQDMLGIKTADYEYNETKDKLLTYFQSNIEKLRLLFWFNIITFYFICVFVPFYFVEECNGIQWSGHSIYIAYAVFICVLECLLAQICIKYGVTHDSYSKGDLLQRFKNFLKDLILSQLSKFDVYSDFCFISTVMNCGDHNVIGYISIAVMFVTLSSTTSQLWTLLTIKAKGTINYFDFVCNYCSFAEIHLVASLLERWTVQNQNDFLCIKGIPSRVYASIVRSFVEDLPQFLLQLIYINITVESSGLLLNLSLASSIISIIISLTKTLTITKANRITDKIQIREVKNELQVREGDVDPELKQNLIDYLYVFSEKT